jgi:hypothetical protein
MCFVKVQAVPATQQVIKYIFRICFTIVEYVRRVILK